MITRDFGREGPRVDPERGPAGPDPLPLPLTSLTDDDQHWRDQVRALAETRIRPFVAQMDADSNLASEVLQELFASGLMGIEVPRLYGGKAKGFFQVCLAIEEIARVDPAVAVYVHVQNSLVIRALLNWGSGDQKRRYLPRLATSTVGAYALSEAEAGSDAFALTTTAEPDESEFVLNGRKCWTSCAREASLFLVFARLRHEGTDPVTAFIVDRSTPGLTVGKKSEQMGIRASSTYELILDNVRVRKDNMLGRPGDGTRIAMDTLNFGRVGIAAQMVGLGQGALDAAVSYAQKRRQFGQRIASFQGVQFQLAHMATEVEAARLLAYNAARLMEHSVSPEERIRFSAMAKYFSSLVAERTASRAVEIFGGNGFLRDFPVEKFYRDAKIGSIYEGTSNMQLRTVATLLLQGSRQEASSPHDHQPASEASF